MTSRSGQPGPNTVCETPLNPSSAADLNSVLDYIAAHSPRGAQRVQARIQAIVDLVLLHPGIGTRTDDSTIRRMIALPYPYLIFYEATETEIIIHAIRHAARNPSGMPGDDGPPVLDDTGQCRFAGIIDQDAPPAAAAWVRRRSPLPLGHLTEPAGEGELRIGLHTV